MKQRAGSFLALTLVWTTATAVGFERLVRYANTEGEPLEHAGDWPAGSKIQASRKFSTFLLFAHPQCPCSQASLGELERLMPKLWNRAKIYVVFNQPEDKTLDWVKSDLWRKAQSIPGVEIVIDKGGLEAARFGAKTSGQVAYFDSGRKLVFNGGITPQRGHMGDSDGRAAILAHLGTGKAAVTKTPVFGCSMSNQGRVMARGGQ